MKTTTQHVPIVRLLFHSKVHAIIILWAAGCHAGQFPAAKFYGDSVSLLNGITVLSLTIMGIVLLYSHQKTNPKLDDAEKLAGELVAVIRVNALHGDFKATHEQVEEFLEPFIVRLRNLK